MTSKQKCVTHAQATLPRLRELTFGCEVAGIIPMGVEVACLEDGRIAKAKLFSREMKVPYENMKVKIIGHTPTLGDWLELLGRVETISKMTISHDADMLHIFSPDITFNLATNEPSTEKDWDVLANLLGL
jgi:hypothetical protein